MPEEGYIPRMPTPPPTLSHHRPGGGFQNPWPNAQVAGFKALLRWRFFDRREHPAAPAPRRDSFPRRTPSIITPRAATGYHSATWVGHSTVLLQLGPLNVLTDPMWSER